MGASVEFKTWKYDRTLNKKSLASVVCVYAFSEWFLSRVLYWLLKTEKRSNTSSRKMDVNIFVLTSRERAWTRNQLPSFHFQLLKERFMQAVIFNFQFLTNDMTEIIHVNGYGNTAAVICSWNCETFTLNPNAEKHQTSPLNKFELYNALLISNDFTTHFKIGFALLKVFNFTAW